MLLGNLPPEGLTSAFCRSPPGLTRNEVIELLPALTTNSSLPSELSVTSPWVSRNGHVGMQPGCSCWPPVPPVATALTNLTEPSAKRWKICTWLRLGLLVSV